MPVPVDQPAILDVADETIQVPSTRAAMSTRILKLLDRAYRRSERDMDFVELTRKVAGFWGESMWLIADNLVVWPALSEDAVYVLQGLLVGRRIKLRPVSHILYVEQGVRSNLRLAADVHPCSGFRCGSPARCGQGPVR